jgi:hypothetical protein
MTPSTRLLGCLLHGLHWPPIINFAHDPLCQRNRVCNGALQRGRWPSIPLGQLPRCQDTRSDEQHALAAFIHVQEFTSFAFVSPFQASSHAGEYCTPAFLVLCSSVHFLLAIGSPGRSLEVSLYASFRRTPLGDGSLRKPTARSRYGQ